MTQDIFKSLTKSQKMAVEKIDGPVLVIAGPGTGKTQLLALRTANILLKTDVQPQNILCLTYTDSATRNMRERMSKYIGKHAYDVNISTYHGFGSDIIKNNKEYFLQYNAEQPIDALMQHQILDEIYKTISSNNVLWKKDTYLKDALQFISEAKRAGLQPKDINLIAKENKKDLNSLNKLTKKYLKSLNRMSKSDIALFESLFIACKSLPEPTKQLPINIPHLSTLFINDLAEAYIEANSTNSTKSLTKFKNDWLTKDLNDEWTVKGEPEIAKLLGASDIYNQYLSKLKEKNLFDYDDMILRAIDALIKHKDLRFSLQEKYQYIMLDEFQDTNKAQLKLIELLTNNPANEGQPNILAVGDDDQAIFSFQGAEVDNMISFNNLYKNVTTITLKENWRSHQSIINVSKKISSQIEKRLHHKLGIQNKELTASNKTLPNKATIEQHNFLSDVTELNWVADKIHQIIQIGQNPSGIAVLAPKHKYLESLLPFLENNNTPIKYQKRENILEDEHIANLINMLKLINALNKNNYEYANELWPQILSSNEWQIPTSLIWKVSWQANKNKYSSDNDSNWMNIMLKDNKLKPIALFFIKLANMAKTATLESILDYCIGLEPLEINEHDIKKYKSPYYEYFFSSESSKKNTIKYTQLLSNLTVLRQKLREYALQNEGYLKLTDALEYIEALNMAGEKLLNTSPYHTSEKAVELITAYSAKGLEFDTVFVMATLDEVWGMKARSSSSKIQLPKNLQIIRFAGAQKDEKKRLFYVALTRAKHSIYITSHSSNYAGKQTTQLEFLNQQDNQDNNEIKLINHTENAKAPNAQILHQNWHYNHFNKLNQPQLIDLLKDRLQDFQLSATHLNAFTDMEYGGPKEFFVNTILRFPKAPKPDGEYGSAIHESLEFIQSTLKKSQELPDTQEIQYHFAKKLSKKTLTKNEYEQYRNRGEVAISAFMQWWWQNFDIQNMSEVDFRHEGSFYKNAHLTGKLDYLVFDHHLKTIQVVDFKTGNSFNSWSKSTKSHKYKQQLIFYKILLENSHSYKNYSVEEGRIVFVEPNYDNTITELKYSYKKSDIERTKLLILAIWQRIHSLDLPDTSTYSKNIKGTLEFEDWLINNYKP